MPHQLHAYQTHAVSHLHARPRAGLFLDMGLGKTAVVLSALKPEHLPVLVVAPKRPTTMVWPEEAGIWRPDLSIAVATGSPAQRLKALRSSADIVVIGRDVIDDANDKEFGGKFKTLVLDELSGFKNRQSARFKSAVEIINRGMPYVWGLTGTPTPNGLLDLWAQMCLLDGGLRLGWNITAFRKEFFTIGRQLPNGVVISYDLIPGAEATIHEVLSDICLGMTSETYLELPDMIENTVEVPLTGEAKRMYREMKRDYVTTYKGRQFYAPSAAALSGKLSQIVGGFIYHNDDNDTLAAGDGSYSVIHNEKVKALQEIIDGTGTPVIVFYRYTAEKEMILTALGKGAFTTDTPDLQARWNAGELPVLVAHPQSIGHGLNLQKGPGHTMVWYNLPWGHEEFSQSNKRLQRQGQKHVVMQHRLITPKTIDPLILIALNEKRSVEQALMEYLERS